MNTQLLIQSINTLLTLQGKECFDFSSLSIQKKIKNVVNQLELKAKEIDQSSVLLIRIYANFYIHIFQMNSSNMILLKVNEFFEKSNLEALPKFSDNDIDLAYKVEESWNSMHTISSDEFPFQIRKYLIKSKIKIMDNTFFRHSSEFHYCCMIAKFINENRLNFPQIHSIKEFFLHLPIVLKWPKNYCIYNYMNCNKTLNQYYDMVYDKNIVKDRLSKFLSTLTIDSLDYLQNSSIWCKSEAIVYLNEKRF